MLNRTVRVQLKDSNNDRGGDDGQIKCYLDNDWRKREPMNIDNQESQNVDSNECNKPFYQHDQRTGSSGGNKLECEFINDTSEENYVLTKKKKKISHDNQQLINVNCNKCNNNSIVESRSALNNITDHLIGQVGSSKALSSEKQQVWDNQNDIRNVSKDQIIIGSANFEVIIKARVFVDKTMLIKDFVDSPYQVTLITCPRRFGKSTNMQMIKSFLRLHVDGDGNVEKKVNHVFSVKSLQIMEEKEFVNTNLGNHPVIFVNFLNATGYGYENTVDGIKGAISEAFEEHKYMIKVLRNLSKENTFDNEDDLDDLAKFKRIMIDGGSKANDKDIRFSLKYLTKLLFIYYGKKVFILIDEYDAPVHSAMQNNLDVVKIKDYVDQILCTALKDNIYLEKGLMTGISEMIRCSATSGLNNVKTCKFLGEHPYSKYYGFTEKEVSTIIKDFGFDVNYENKVKKWYNGYLANGGKMCIYNPWSIVNCIADKSFRKYWEESGFLKNVSELFLFDGIRSKVVKLVNSDSIELNLRDKLNGEDLKILKRMFDCKRSNSDLKEDHINLFFSFIFELGYLSFDNNPGFVKIPNKEIKTEFMKKILNYYVEQYTFKDSDVKDAIRKLDSILENERTDTIDDFKVAISKLISPLDLKKIEDHTEDGFHPNEDLFHSILNWIALQSNASKFGTEVWYNHEARSDIILINRENIGIVIELKFDGDVSLALKQTEKYMKIFEPHAVKFIKRVGINITKNKIVDIKVDVQKCNHLLI